MFSYQGNINRNTVKKRLSAPSSQSSSYLIDSKTLLCVPSKLITQ